MRDTPKLVLAKLDMIGVPRRVRLYTRNGHDWSWQFGLYPLDQVDGKALTTQLRALMKDAAPH